jgi:hypothetical protein
MTMMPEKDQQRQLLYALLGDLPPKDRLIRSTVVEQGERDGYVLERLLLDLNGFEPVPAYFVKPRNAGGRIPCMLYNHAHGGNYLLGKDELLLGRQELCAPAYAQALTFQGWGALCIDTWVFGERGGRTESEVFKEMLWKGQVLWGMMVYDTLRGLDYLLTRPEVDASRAATLGMSMGSTMSWWVAALDPRVKVCADISCLTDFDALIESKGLGGHGIYYFVPSLLKHFTASQINALIAPRAHIGVAGNLDNLTPSAGLDRIDRELKQVYADAGKPENWKLLRYDVEHMETPGMRIEILSFLREKL